MYLGLDLGTSELKALLLDDSQRVHALVRAPLSVTRAQPLWSEQDPAQWWAALEQVMAELRARHRDALARVRAIGLAGQMHGATLLDANGEVLRPAILWNDGRSGAQCEALARAVPELGRIAGNLAMPGFTAPKLMWVREHEPAIFARVARVLLPKDWLRFQLSGEAVSDLSDAAGTLWLDVGARDWSDALLAASGMRREQMPRLVEGSKVAAMLDPALAARWGIGIEREGRSNRESGGNRESRTGDETSASRVIPIAGGAGDNAASAIGMGLVAPGQGFVSLGTSGVVFVTTDRFVPNPEQALHAFCHALPNRWHQMSVMLSAAGAVEWASQVWGFGNVAALLEAAATLSGVQRERAPLFVPYLCGERSPHNAPDATGALLGLTHAHAAPDIAWAVVEGVSFGLRDGFDTLRVPAETPLRDLALVGGGARSAWWGQLLADVLQVPLNRHADSEAGAALGAARLAWLADGGSVDAVCQPPPIEQTYTPSEADFAAHAARLARFRVACRMMLQARS